MDLIQCFLQREKWGNIKISSSLFYLNQYHDQS